MRSKCTIIIWGVWEGEANQHTDFHLKYVKIISCPELRLSSLHPR